MTALLMRITFLGTAAARPTVWRGVSGTALRLGGQSVLVDTGENTQRQMLRYGVGLSADLVCFTHFHGDHWLGLEPWMRSLRLMGATRPMTLCGPAERIHQTAGAVVQRMINKTTYPIEVLGVGDGDRIERQGWSVTAVRVEHSVPAMGWVFEEPTRAGRFHVDKAQALGLKSGPDYGRLQRGEAVTGPKGQVIEPSDVLGPSRPGRRIVFSGDTRPCQAVINAARGAEVLVHEGTFGEEHADRALQTTHSTAREAGWVAAQAGVKHLVINHLSARYDNEPNLLRDEAATEYKGPILIAEDGMSLELHADGALSIEHPGEFAQHRGRIGSSS